MLAADGRIVWLRDMVSLGAEPGEFPKLQGIMVEVTVRKQAEEKIRFMQMKFQKTNQDLLQKNQEIQKFYHTLSHELKTPLTSAREFISILMDGNEFARGGERRFEFMRESVIKLLDLLIFLQQVLVCLLKFHLHEANLFLRLLANGDLHH